MPLLTLYRILTFLLLIVAGLLLMLVVAMLPTALANPPYLLPVFLIACVVIYSYSSWVFLQRSIDRRQPCRPWLRDLIRVNSFVTIGLSLLSLVQVIEVLITPTLLAEQAEEVVKNVPPESDLSPESILRILRIGMQVALAYSLLLLVHTLLTFRFLKLYRHLFRNPDEER